MPPEGPLTPDTPARPWLPWLALGLVAGAAGMVGPSWWWLALVLAPLAAVTDRRYPIAARAMLGLAAMCAGGWLARPVVPPVDEVRLYATEGTVIGVLWRSHTQGFLLRPASTDDPAGYLPRTLVVKAPALPAVEPGDRVMAKGLWDEDERGERLQATAVERVLREDTARGFAWRAVDRIGEHRELAAALLLGRGDPPEKDLFRRTGLVHLLAVSGMHLALAAAMGAWLLRKAGIGWTTRQIALGVLLVGYTWLTAAAPATVRALAMALAVLAYALLAREPHRLGAVSLAALVLVLWDPGVAKELGFQLSLVAVLGLVTLGVDLIRLRERWAPLEPLPLDRPTWKVLLFGVRSTADGLCIGVAASLATFPVLAGAFGAISPWSALTTLLASPPTTAALWTGLPLLTLAGIWPDGPWEGLYQLVEWSLGALVAAVKVADLLPGRMACPPVPVWILLLWPLAFVPCDRPVWTEEKPFPWWAIARLGIAVLLLGIWWMSG